MIKSRQRLPANCRQEIMMKAILTATFLALVANLAFAGARYTSGMDTSLYAFERGDPDEYQRVFPNRVFSHPQAPAVSSLAQFDKGDPDETVTSGYIGGYHGRADEMPTSIANTSLARFEQGDPDESPGL
jgi:hypothetical protein